MVQGAMEYLRDGLKVPQEVKDWTKAQRETWDDIGQFFTECCQQETHQNNPAKYALHLVCRKQRQTVQHFRQVVRATPE